jgi:hypothetical protein
MAGSVGGRQVAFVNASTKRRTKKRGKVPPRLETLVMLSVSGDFFVVECQLTSRVVSCMYRRCEGRQSSHGMRK